ncbi:hypothetical protein [Absidia glauca]|uniref:Methyltransferase domain-containing protein n=1 Tax=Absidia glauca TaxID=4829 RepID=A0A168QYV1_ABSGL|nr:hypothetical protein [Absidia glauca]
MGQQHSKRIFRRRKNLDTTSLPSPVATSSSFTKASMFRYKEGRRYHEDESIPYVLPNDDEGSNFEVPLREDLEKGHLKVLDAGCGPGTWLFDMAEDFPHCHFYGIDVAPVFPQGIKPSNVTFALANLTEPLPYPDHHFDYIHQRLLLFGLTLPQWDVAMQELLRVLKPGGWIEFVEIDQEAHNRGPLLKIITDAMTQMLVSRNMVPDISERLVNYMEKYQLDHIHTTIKDFPMRHSGKVGDLFWDDFQRVAHAVQPIVSQTHSEWSSSQGYKDYLLSCADECTANQTTLSARSVWAQKPCVPVH